MNIKIKIEDNSQKVLQELQNKMPEILNGMGNEMYKNIYDFMTEDAIVDTGRLRGSISYSTEFNDYNNPIPANKPEDFIVNVRKKNNITIGSNVEYANFVETGTTKQRARNYLRTGIQRSLLQMQRVVEIILKEET